MNDKPKLSAETVVQIFTAIGTAVALILLAFGYISPAAGDNEATARGVTNFDSITLSEDLVVGDDVTSPVTINYWIIGTP